MEAATSTIAVVGVGAIGGSIAADLWDLGRHELRLCVRSPIDQLWVTHPQGQSRVQAPVSTDPAQASPTNWVLLATKAHHSAQAAPWLRSLCGPETIVAVLQNGVDHVERITPLVPKGTEVLPVVVQLPAEKHGAGEVTQERDGALTVPEGDSGRRFAQLFEGARTKIRVSEDFGTQAWWKLISNAALGGVCAATQRSNGVAREPSVRELVLGLMREVVLVGRAEGAKLPDDAPEKSLDMMLAGAGDHWTSIAVDRREGRPMEWRARNEVVGRLGRLHGIPTPMNDALTSLLRAADAAGDA